MEYPHNIQEYQREGNDITASDMIVPEEDSDLLEFYKDSTVFITGATGFLGKLCMEKLLRVCTVKRIYVLVRPKKGKDIEKRFKELFDEPSFEPLKRKKPDFREKVRTISGDASLPDLGISKQDQEMLISEVDCIIHCAATVRFDESIKLATYINVRGVRDLLRLSKRIKNLRAFVHVSTAYSNCLRKVIEEKFYPPPMSADKLITLVECLDDDKLKAITPVLLGKIPNTYVYTKCVAEQVVEEEGKSLPTALYRPSIVIATSKEPVAGWIDNVYGATGIFLGSAMGLLRILHADSSNRADLVPADFVVNSILAVAWEIASFKTLNNNEEQSKEEKFENDIPVYNYISTNEKPQTWEDFRHYTVKYGMQIPSEQCIWYYMLWMTPNKYFYQIFSFLMHTLPAYIVDFIAVRLGKKPMLVKGYEKVHKFSAVISYFTNQEWEFKNNNIQALWRKLKPQDKELFDFDMRALDWDLYYYTYTRGGRIYILKDPMDTVPRGKKWYTKLKIAHYTILTLLSLLALRFFTFLLNIVFEF